LPPEQVRVAMPVLEQDWAQPPQWLGSVSMLRSQPSVCLFELQSAKPVLQAPVQTLAEQMGVAMFALEQMRLQAPQFCVSVEMARSQPFVRRSLSQFA